MSEDPIGFKAGVNFYAYVNNNPLTNNDPSGLFAGFFMPPVGGGLTIDQKIAITNAQTTGVAFSGLAAGGIFTVPVIPSLVQSTVAGTSALTGLTAEQITTFGVLGGESALMATFGVPGSSFTPSFAGNTGVTRAFDLSAAVTTLADLGDKAITNTSNFFSGFFGSSPQSSGASGGFVLYPNKINNNQTNSVYNK